jgi:O-antigen ligase
MSRFSPLRPRLTGLLWVLLLLSLPVTSFPYFPGGVGGQTLVRPLAVFPLIGLALVAILPALWKQPLPRVLLPLAGFVLAAAASSLLGIIGEAESLRGVSQAERLLRNLVTLGIGGGLYLALALLPASRADLEAALRWIYAGFSLALAWGSLQAVYVLRYSEAYFKLLDRLQDFISTRRLFDTRISGMTYEPNWFAEQICFLLLPWLLSAVLLDRSLFRWRWRRVSVELLLLVWSSLLMVFTYSRVGLFTLVTVLAAGFLFFRRRQPARQPGAPGLRWRRAAEAGLAAAVLLGVIFLAGTQNRYFSRLWRFFTEETGGERFLEYIAFDQRITYWQTAYTIYSQHPWLGVGLGNYAFYFQEALPRQSWHRQPEILRQITPGEGNPRLITPKNLYVRLLAETGVIGTGLFLCFLLGLLGHAIFLWLSPAEDEYYWGAAGLLGLLVFSIGALSFDSFALPNMWVVFGLITAARRLSTQPAAAALPAAALAPAGPA